MLHGYLMVKQFDILLGLSKGNHAHKPSSTALLVLFT